MPKVGAGPTQTVLGFATTVTPSAGMGAMGLPGSGTSAGIGVPATISPSGSARAPGAGGLAPSPKATLWKVPGIPGNGHAPGKARRKQRPGLEHVMVAPMLPHALGEVGIEVAVEYGIAGRLVAVAEPPKLIS